MDDPEKYRTHLGHMLDVIIDRPLGSKHPTYKFAYQTNYGYVENTLAGDGHEIDAYVLGVNIPVTHFTGVCVAVILRSDDDEHKLVVASQALSANEIDEQTQFVEHYYDTQIETMPPTSQQMLYALRPALLEDLGPMMAIGHEGLRPHVEQVRGWDQAAEEQGFRDHFEPDKIQIIQSCGEDIGYIKAIDQSDHVYVDGMYISNTRRSSGIGGRVLADLIDRNRKVGKPIRLKVFTVNPAKRLYDRLGFRVVEETVDSFIMECAIQ